MALKVRIVRDDYPTFASGHQFAGLEAEGAGDAGTCQLCDHATRWHARGRYLLDQFQVHFFHDISTNRSRSAG